MVVLSYSVIYYIYIPGTLGPCFHYWCSVYGICKWSDTLWPVGRVRLFADYTISLSSLCKLIWKHWTTKMLVRYMMPSVCLRLRQFSQLSLYSLYGAVCLQLTQLSCDDRENVYFILLSSSNRKYESLPLFRVRSWNNGMRCMSYYVLMNLWYDYIASWDISCPGGFCPESGPLSLGMQHHYFARYPTDEWHLANVFSLVYFSVVVCLRGLYHHILLATARALCQGQCTPHARFPLTERGRINFWLPPFR